MRTENLKAEILEAAEGLNLNGKGDPDAALEAIDQDIFKGRLERIIKRELAAHERPDYSSHTADGNELVKLARNHKERWLVDRMIDEDSSNLIIAPSNVGGSTFQLHLARCLLTGLPVLGSFTVPTDKRFEVVWINPEEQASTPGDRLGRMRLTKDQLAHFHQIHTRDERLYFNVPVHVEVALETIDAMRIDPALDLVLVLDGLQGTLRGDLWGQDLEAWKDGIGTLRDALKPSALIVRSQTTASGQRQSVGGTKRVHAEDAAGGQIMHWPDNRLTINRTDNGDRLLTVRGRLQDNEWSIGYEWNPKNYELLATDSMRKTLAELAITRLLTAGPWRAEGLTSKRKVAAYLFAQAPEGPAERTYQRSLEAWDFDEQADKWENLK